MSNRSTRTAPAHLPRHRGRGNGPRAPRGMTLIEIMVSLAVVATVLLVAVPTIEAYAGVRAREEAGNISGAIRYMYGQSALSGKVCRLTFDLDARTWWPECTEGRFTLERDKERASGGKRTEEQKPDRQRSRGTDVLKDEGELMRERVEKKAEFSDFQSEDIKKRKLPDGAELSVWTAHQRERYSKGKAFLYFFPQGHTERAQIYVSSGHGDVYTLAVSPLNGKVKVVDRELDVPRD
jgi:general secretion pathway protein H